jgi:hypothetical protein
LDVGTEGEREEKEIVGAEFVAQETGEFLVLFGEGVLPVGAEDVVAMPRIRLLRRVPKISLMRLAVKRQRPISQLRSRMLWMGKWRLKMKLRQYSIWAME